MLDNENFMKTERDMRLGEDSMYIHFPIKVIIFSHFGKCYVMKIALIEN